MNKSQELINLKNNIEEGYIRAAKTGWNAAKKSLSDEETITGLLEPRVPDLTKKLLEGTKVLVNLKAALEKEDYVKLFTMFREKVDEFYNSYTIYHNMAEILDTLSWDDERSLRPVLRKGIQPIVPAWVKKS